MSPKVFSIGKSYNYPLNLSYTVGETKQFFRNSMNDIGFDDIRIDERFVQIKEKYLDRYGTDFHAKALRYRQEDKRYNYIHDKVFNNMCNK